ncbi:uncharacterized protein MONOS_5518 [Monocercomonoides exilis]|uniref:uncharacterized protein n=1 Tax=Monocercomonoides exilis TaxID=2049356 RepID=UPI003559A642|nr:hypothetical protein MONOS_5518 [Monocercomonoides exilis]|eukprot:MONOS_5518.1-p1 / transcript=MONOS_5518.1 / gene=MONOS_5518 / organism=Monocercomonoides_exilis_PA203 / gene_product=unspecified product / transcript_product=unspecified product / location=Mono_scaffold00162:2731-3309(-) / protein_length=193 / sequence_SO=supercontig / SO=protein_coding / is_pseudo=false
MKLDDEVMWGGVAACEVGEIVEKGLDVAGLRMEDVALSPAAIVLDVLKEREEAEEGERGGKEGEKEGEKEGKEDGGREEGDGNEAKGVYPTTYREFVERIKENQGKLEDAMELLVVKALGMSGLRFVKAETWKVIFSERSLSQMLNKAFILRACCATLEYARNKNVTAGKEYECLSISSVKSQIEITEDVEQ